MDKNKGKILPPKIVGYDISFYIKFDMLPKSSSNFILTICRYKIHVQYCDSSLFNY